MIQLIPVIQSYEHIDSLKNIYHDSFPADERRDWHQILELTQHPHFNLYSIINNNSPAGLITVWRWPELTFIEHFAINETLQGKGIGSEVLRQLIQVTTTRIVLETEEPLTESAKRRIVFYNRLGFHSCMEKYVQPAYSLDKKSIKMVLMSHPDQITSSEFIAIRAQLYKEVYNRNIADFL